MASKVPELFLLSREGEFQQEEEQSSQSEIDFEAETQTLDHGPYWSSPFLEMEDETLIPPIFSPEINLQRSDYDNENALTLDLFDRCPPPQTLDTSSIQPSDYHSLGLALGFEEDPPMYNGDGLHVVEWLTLSDSESDPNSHHQGSSLPLCWDTSRFDGQWRDSFDGFEWEEVDDDRVDEMDFLSMRVGEMSRSSEFDEDEDENEEGRSVDWEVLLAINNVVVDEGGFVSPEYELLFEHFADHDSAVRGTPPAAKSVVDNLPSIVLTYDNVAKNNAICAVCKDDISLEEKVKQLPCLHHYHGECILPWLGMRNTCPVCRFELPTDDAEYESWKAQRSASN